MDEKNQKKMNIMVATDLNYLYPARVLLTSLMHNHFKDYVDVYFLYSGLSEVHLNETKEIVESWENKKINMIEIKPEYLNGLKGFGRFSVAAFYRIIGMQLLPKNVDRVLYLDVDMIVNKSINELFEIQMDAPIMACYDINNYFQGNINYHKAYLGMENDEDYFNSGMLLIDMRYVHADKTVVKLLDDIDENFDRYELVDQDALNKYYRGKVCYLDWKKYNCPCIIYIGKKGYDLIEKEDFYTYAQIKNKIEDKVYDLTENILLGASIIHFCTESKPWENPELYNANNMKQIFKIYKRYERMLDKKIKKYEKNHSKS